MSTLSNPPAAPQRCKRQFVNRLKLAHTACLKVYAAVTTLRDNMLGLQK